MHPADLGWIACVPAGEYDGLLQKFPALRRQIIRNTAFEGGYAMVAYMEVKTRNKLFHETMEALEVHGGRVSDDIFFKLHYDRWRAFGEGAAQSDALNIFECAFMQNHVNELLFWRNADDEAVIAHHQRLLDCVRQLSPVLIYLSQPDVRQTILRVAEERPGWMERVIAYSETSEYGKRSGIQGFEGAMEFFELRKRLEQKLLTQLDIPYIIIENPNYDWDDVWAKITAYLTDIQQKEKNPCP